jgi:outer membrane cobalamin receptor
MENRRRARTAIDWCRPAAWALAGVLSAGAAGGAGPDAAEPADAAADARAAARFYSTATVTARPLATATAAVTVIDRDRIEASGARTVGELLRHAAGVWVVDGGTRGGFTTARIRGGDPNMTLVLLDGVPLNDVTDQVGGAVNLESLPAAGIERIEIVRGPAAQGFGLSSLGGVVNVVTDRGPREGRRWRAEVEAGDAAYARAGASLAAGSGGRRSLLSATWEEEAERIAEERFEQLGLLANLGLDLGPRAGLELGARLAGWEAADYPEASGGPALGSGELRRIDHAEASGRVELLLGRESRRPQRLVLSIARHEREVESPAIGFLVPAARESTTFTRTRAAWLGRAIAGDDAELRLGAGVDREEGDNRSRLLLPPEAGGEIAGDYAHSRTLGHAFAETTLARGDWTVEASARLDAAEGFGPEWSPRLGASVRPGGGPTRLHASAARAFKLPSFFALASPPALGGNPDLAPERSRGIDLGVERSFAAAGLGLDLTVFYQRYDDLIDFDFGSFRHLNRARVESRGAELTWAWTPAASLLIEGNLTWNRAEDLETSQPLRHRPEVFGGVRLDWRPGPDLSLRLESRATSSQHDEQIPVPGRDTVPGYRVTSAGAGWRFAPGWELTARIDNLLDAGYETAIGFPGPGRSLRLGLRFSGAEGVER